MENQPPIPHGSQQRQVLTQKELLQQARPLEFAQAEELIRYDASQTPPPAGLEDRVRASVDQTPIPRVPWWKRLWGGRRGD